MKIPQFNTKLELQKFICENKDLLTIDKKATFKQADSVDYSLPIEQTNDFTNKDVGIMPIADTKSVVVKVVMNTTNILDSHNDVHIDGLWKKTIQENKNILHLQEHQRSFDKVLSRDVNATTKTISWKSLGYDFQGSTQALIFESKLDNAEYNQMMINQYLAGNVKNHSVGMRYVNIAWCVNSEEKWAREEKANWDKYYPMIANKDVADERGYFSAVTEAKLIEGSAVLIGSNYATPTISVSEAASSTSSKIEPTEVTHKQEVKINYSKLKFI